MKYAFIDRHRSLWPVSILCEQLDVSPSGYHQHRQRRALHQGKPGGRVSNDALLAHIKAIHAQVKGEYGWPRIWKQLLANGIRVGKERVRKLMALHGIRAKTRRKFKATTNSAHLLPVAPNLIARNFSPASAALLLVMPVAICSQNRRSISRRCDGAPDERIAPRPVNLRIHSAGRPINTSSI